MPIVYIASQKLATNTVQINCASRDTLCPNTTILAWENRVRTGSFGKGSLPYFYSHSCDVPPVLRENIGWAWDTHFPFAFYEKFLLFPLISCSLALLFIISPPNELSTTIITAAYQHALCCLIIILQCGTLFATAAPRLGKEFILLERNGSLSLAAPLFRVKSYGGLWPQHKQSDDEITTSSSSWRDSSGR